MVRAGSAVLLAAFCAWPLLATAGGEGSEGAKSEATELEALLRQ